VREDGQHARVLLGSGGVDREDAGMRVRAAKDLRMDESGQVVSAPYWALPVTFSTPSGRMGLVPMTE